MTSSAALRSGEPHELMCARTMDVLDAVGVPFLVGGTFAFAFHTGEERTTKDLDIMICRRDLPAALDALSVAGCETSLPYPHWLAKATQEDFLVDLIFASGNGVARVDHTWFAHATRADLFGRQVLVAPVEELIWSKAFVMERERYDGADVAHLFWACGLTLDWDRLEQRFGEFLPVLLIHVIQFLFAYSDGWQRLPHGVLERLQRRMAPFLQRAAPTKTCRGTLLSRQQYLYDVEHRGYVDSRTALGSMSADEVEIWTAAIDDRS